MVIFSGHVLTRNACGGTTGPRPECFPAGVIAASAVAGAADDRVPTKDLSWAAVAVMTRWATVRIGLMMGLPCNSIARVG